MIYVQAKGWLKEDSSTNYSDISDGESRLYIPFLFIDMFYVNYIMFGKK